MKKNTLLIAAVIGALATPSLLAQMNMGGMDMPGMDMGNRSAPQKPTLAEPAKTVFDYYLKIQTQLAQDSLQTAKDARMLQENALVIATAIRHDSTKTFSDDVAQQAETLAKAKELKTAREAFKPLSESLIKFRDAHKDQAGQFIKVFCSMANAAWLQDGSTVNNPYLGQAMARCGQIEN